MSLCFSAGDSLKCCRHNVIASLSPECQCGEKFKQARTNGRSNHDVSTSDDNLPPNNRYATTTPRKQQLHTPYNHTLHHLSHTTTWQTVLQRHISTRVKNLSISSEGSSPLCAEWHAFKVYLNSCIERDSRQKTKGPRPTNSDTKGTSETEMRCEREERKRVEKRDR